MSPTVKSGGDMSPPHPGRDAYDGSNHAYKCIFEVGLYLKKFAVGATWVT
jgi:hypothetical protein